MVLKPCKNTSIPPPKREALHYGWGTAPKKENRSFRFPHLREKTDRTFSIIYSDSLFEDNIEKVDQRSKRTEKVITHSQKVIDLVIRHSFLLRFWSFD
jgi:hypothetical protein